MIRYGTTLLFSGRFHVIILNYRLRFHVILITIEGLFPRILTHNTYTTKRSTLLYDEIQVIR